MGERMPQWTLPAASIGTIIAIIALILAVLLAILGRLQWEYAGFIIALAIARLT